MGGRRRSLLSGSGFPTELAQRLRDLRDARELTLRQLAAKSGYSYGALSQAEAGRAVPSWELVTAFVQACGEDPVRWRHTWELARATPTQSEPPLTALDIDEAVPGEPARRLWRRPILAPAAAAALLVLSAAVAWLAVDQPQTRSLADAIPSARLLMAARDDTDPYIDGCKADEKQLDWKPVYRKSGGMLGSIALMYSPECQAAWGYLYAPNSSAWTIHIITRRMPGPGVVQWQFSGAAAPGSWGNVLSTRRGCVYTEAYIVDKSGEGPHSRTACIQP